jgi:hypothetical protein
MKRRRTNISDYDSYGFAVFHLIRPSRQLLRLTVKLYWTLNFILSAIFARGGGGDFLWSIFSGLRSRCLQQFIWVFMYSIRYLCPSLSRTMACLNNSVKPPSIVWIHWFLSEVGRCIHSISSEDGDRFNLLNAGYFMNIRRDANCILLRQRSRPLELTRQVW